MQGEQILTENAQSGDFQPFSTDVSRETSREWAVVLQCVQKFSVFQLQSSAIIKI